MSQVDVSKQVFRAVLAGCGGMGRRQAEIARTLDGFELCGVCDIFEENAQRVAQENGVTAYTDFSRALSEQNPDVVIICSNNATHASLTIEAANHPSVKGVYCEKPMATNMGDARRMVAACREKGVYLVINHQRRIQPDMVKARELITSGAIGEVKWLRGNCAGDILSDGTHLVNSLFWLAGDANVKWVAGSIVRDIESLEGKNERLGREGTPGFRYGHPVESGGRGCWMFENGIYVEINCGELSERFRIYQDYEVIGSKGRLWRTGDKYKQNLFICDGQGGDLIEGLDDWVYKPIPAPEGERGLWRTVELQKAEHGIVQAYRMFHDTLENGTPHPMSGENALREFEVVMAIYESARLRKRLEMPLKQDRFPLEVMLEDQAAT